MRLIKKIKKGMAVILSTALMAGLGAGGSRKQETERNGVCDKGTVDG